MTKPSRVAARIRRATPADLDGIVTVFLHCWRRSYAQVLPEPVVSSMTDARALELWTPLTSGDAPATAGGTLVATDDAARVIGVTRWSVDRPSRSGHIGSLYVDPDAQAGGVGAGLLDRAVDAIAGSGARVATLWVFEPNAAARRFYGRHGFRPDGTTRIEPEFGVPELRLSRALESAWSPAGAHELDPLAERLVSHAPAGCSPPAGAVVGVECDGSRHVGVAGQRVAAPAQAAPMTRATSHDLASVTKVVATTTALMRLVSDGHVNLDDVVRTFLPAFRGGAKDTVTVRDLLLHRGGLWEWQPVYVAVAGDHADVDAAYRFIDELPLRDAPRRTRRYSDLGFVQLGRIVSAVTSAPLVSVVTDLVTTPLGLGSIQFGHPVEDPVAMSAVGDRIEIEMIDTGVPYPTSFRSDAFTRWRHDVILGDVCDGNAFHAFDGVSGHAGLFGHVDDLLTWAAAMSDANDRGDLWRAPVADEFFDAGPDPEQALGFRRYRIASAGDAVVLGHPGFVGCAVGFVPGQRLAIAMATNRLVTHGRPAPTETMWRAVLEAVLSNKELAP